MNLAVVFDTETTGLPEFKLPSDDAIQPHIVQLAAVLLDLDTREILQEMNVIVRPDGWVISEEVAAVHGITQEIALEKGIPEAEAIGLFLGMMNAVEDGIFQPRDRIAHNEQFDARIIRIALKRYTNEETAEAFASGNKYCTMKESTSIVKCPPTPKMIAAGRRHYKNPNLGEAYQHFTGQPLEGAHDAMVDVKACIAVYFAIQDLKAAA